MTDEKTRNVHVSQTTDAVPSWYPVLDGRYQRYDRWINKLMWVAVFLILMSLFALEWSVRNQRPDLTITTLGTTGVLVSVLIVALVAGRALAFQQIEYFAQKDSAKVKVAHHVMAVLWDVKDRLQYHKEEVQRGSFNTGLLLLNMKKIEERFEKFYDYELFEHFPGEAFELVRSLAGSLLGLTYRNQKLYDESGDVVITLSHELTMLIVSGVDKMLVDISRIEKMVSKLRSEL